MGRFLGAVAAVVAAAAALIVAYVAGAPAAVVFAVGAGVLSLLWLLLLLTLPWNLYFRAHAVLAEIAVSREKGMTVPAARDAEAARIARAMLRAAVAGHLVTAAVLIAVTWATGEFTGYWFAAFFLLSTFFRPAGAYFGQLRRRLGSLLKDVTYPRDDVVELHARLDRAETGSRVLEEKAAEQYRALADLRRTVDALAQRHDERAEAADRRMVALGRQFESTVNRLTDNQELIAGVKAFLRLLRSGDAADGTPAAG
ncbi:hypothetical protein ACWDE0_39240 [Streptomyces sp. 900105755]|uniref:hypothetical protein n=1 Tax=unclassified Streptomyces TaxID=2593676 RepID=UPI00089D46D6|nr:hypothetical protein [Streptomyces sp. Ag109_O5-10]SEF15925.1 hypothetical protein SAMN05216533_7578 [Streptomyces sp. Ag109_O5-10]